MCKLVFFRQFISRFFTFMFNWSTVLFCIVDYHDTIPSRCLCQQFGSITLGFFMYYSFFSMSSFLFPLSLCFIKLFLFVLYCLCTLETKFSAWFFLRFELKSCVIYIFYFYNTLIECLINKIGENCRGVEYISVLQFRFSAPPF